MICECGIICILDVINILNVHCYQRPILKMLFFQTKCYEI